MYMFGFIVHVHVPVYIYMYMYVQNLHIHVHVPTLGGGTESHCGALHDGHIYSPPCLH